jgi:transposase
MANDQPVARGSEAKARLKLPNRKQHVMDAFDLDRLIDAEHPARAIEELVSRLPETGFLKTNRAVEGQAGRTRTSPRMLVALWVYGLTQGIGEASVLAEQMKYEPGLRWLAGNLILSSRTLSGFRSEHGEALREIFAELLAILDAANLIDLRELTLDGMRVQAAASEQSRRREATIQAKLAEAQQVLAELERAGQAAQVRDRRVAAQQRAAAERVKRLEQCAEEVRKVQAQQRAGDRPARVSTTDPEARKMKDGRGGFYPGYNVQSLVETKNKIIVDITVSQSASDQTELQPALERIHAEQPGPHLLVDGGYISEENLAAAQQQGVILVGPVKPTTTEQRAASTAHFLARAGIAAEFSSQAFTILEDGQAMACPAGQRMERSVNGKRYVRYDARARDCAVCAHRAQCCPQSGRRTVKIKKVPPATQAHAQRMEQDQMKQLYKKRGPVAEFPHAWLKEKLGLRRFRTRGIYRVGLEALWAALTYNVQQWSRLVWRPGLAAALAA